MYLLLLFLGKIVFAAPSRPLVMQQIEACHNIVGIPQVCDFSLNRFSICCVTTPDIENLFVSFI